MAFDDKPGIADEVLTQLEGLLAGRAVPRVRALHLPPLPWNGSKDGEFGAIELMADDAVVVVN